MASSGKVPSAAPSRIVIEDVTPRVAGGRFPVKRVVGEPVDVRASVYADGHDVLYTVVSHRPPDSRRWVDVPMQPSNPGLDLWEARFVPVVEGVHRFRIVAWIDAFSSWQQGTLRKLEAGVDVSSDLLAGAALLEEAAQRAPARARRPYLEAAARLREGDTIDVTDPGAGGRPSAVSLFRQVLRLAEATVGDVVEVLVEWERALFSSWYELFPRSWSTDPQRRPHGTLRDVASQLDYVAGLGFDVLYLAPIHPIGESFRKGPNNVETCGPGDPGSPWAIGNRAGGHTAIHPDLGTIEDFRELVALAADNGIDVALDLAFQCSPDHPWVTEHPEWFRHRPDGTIQYAENPPKKYQDIYPLDFETPAWRSLWEALREVVRFWLDQGVRIFRVDNPHTKPFAFWEWLLADVRTTHPRTIFLSEAFTRPRPMHRLAQLGFTQSYTYFTWRVSKVELTEYFTELATPPSVDELRPNAWPNTPDILPWHLQDAPPEMNELRVFLAATLSPSYGIYGPAFELADNRPAGNGKEEYLDSEKYEIRSWDLDDPRSIRPLIATLNRARREQAALHTLRTLRFHDIGNDQMLAYSKTPHEGPNPDPADPARNPVLCIANLDAHSPQSGMVELDVDALGVDPHRPFEVHDLLTDQCFVWEGRSNYVELHPGRRPGHLFRVSQP